MEEILLVSRNLFESLIAKYKENVEWEKGRALFLSLEYRCQATAEHSLVVAFIAYHLMNQITEDSHFSERLFLGGLLHDIGKLNMPDDILKSSHRLITDDERKAVTGHVRIGHEALTKLHFGHDVLQFCLTHHERLDGSGYPGGNLETSMIGRVAAISDIYSALKLPRYYRPDCFTDNGIFQYFLDHKRQYDMETVFLLREFLITGLTSKIS
jgi:putative nucleotidyltransferase with HDIG domain